MSVLLIALLGGGLINLLISLLILGLIFLLVLLQHFGFSL